MHNQLPNTFYHENTAIGWTKEEAQGLSDEISARINFGSEYGDEQRRITQILENAAREIIQAPKNASLKQYVEWRKRTLAHMKNDGLDTFYRLKLVDRFKLEVEINNLMELYEASASELQCHLITIYCSNGKWDIYRGYGVPKEINAKKEILLTQNIETKHSIDTLITYACLIAWWLNRGLDPTITKAGISGADLVSFIADRLNKNNDSVAKYLNRLGITKNTLKTIS
ncbi:hypothetical protein [Vibrio aestuarianus]|uniref:Uncharacterized protein n=1 Tax=Vibrio aestuarianus TaxID=28171 RepID=A0ABD7YLN2_9VIBR|nr:hypothetical protein [Vibrio aestuarianus]WGK85890.1 hypothetical protein PYE67_03435 [Vibrio aestuarianus]CAH8189840.1 hypothetical protein VAEU17_190066 [Vibrio aestuarianus]